MEERPERRIARVDGPEAWLILVAVEPQEPDRFPSQRLSTFVSVGSTVTSTVWRASSRTAPSEIGPTARSPALSARTSMVVSFNAVPLGSGSRSMTF